MIQGRGYLQTEASPRGSDPILYYTNSCYIRTEDGLTQRRARRCVGQHKQVSDPLGPSVCQRYGRMHMLHMSAG